VTQLSHLLEKFESFWPSAHADDWDRVGLTSGNSSSSISTVLVAVDLTETVIDEALALKAELILTHHPLLLKGIDTVAEDQLKGLLLSKAIRNSISVFAAHTNADVQSDGASSLMANSFGLEGLEPLVPAKGGFGHGVIGNLPKGITLGEFAKKVSHALPKTARKTAFSGNSDRLISRVAVCSGAGDSFIPQALASNADVYVTSDLRHHPTLDAISTPRNIPLSLIDVSHWAAESLWVSEAVKKLSEIDDLSVFASQTITDPWTQEVN
jgi:dinuclear metal center YbgI/SA1388 family protein